MATAQLTPIGVGIHNVLIATDFSRYSEQALDFGLQLAKAYHAKTYVVLVVPSDEFVMAGPEAYLAAKEAARRDLENLKVELKKSRACVEGEDYHLYLLEGDVAQSILGFAQQKKADLIVVGTHGRGGFGKALMGSVAEKVFRGSPVPVLTIGPCARHVSNALAPRKILVAADFTPASERAAQYAAELASKHHSNLTLMHVVSPKELDHHPDCDYRILHAMETNLAALLGPEATVPRTYRIVTGRIVPSVLQAAQELEADLLVIGVRRSSPVLNRFMWPNAYEIVRESPCAVLTVRERPE
jgi:nucleotide-binding universal stress UspA family protein